MFKGGAGHGELKQSQKEEEGAPVLSPSATTGIIRTTLLWSEHRAQARQMMTPSAIIY
jgi:hypothetical protein